MKPNRAVALIPIVFMFACNESNEPNPNAERENKSLSTTMQGHWVRMEPDDKSGFHQVDLIFVDNILYWKDSTVAGQGNYSIARMGSSEILYLYNNPEVVNKYMMGKNSMSPGLKDIVIAQWKGKKALNRNYRNVKQNTWEQINEWESGNAAPPMNEAVYVKFNEDQTEATFEFDGDQNDYMVTFKRIE